MKNIRNILKYTLSLVLAAVLLWFCFREVNWQEFLESLKGCRWEWVMLSILAGVLSNWFRAERWREILLPLDAGTSRRSVFNSVNIAYLANFIFHFLTIEENTCIPRTGRNIERVGREGLER